MSTSEQFFSDILKVHLNTILSHLFDVFVVNLCVEQQVKKYLQMVLLWSFLIYSGSFQETGYFFYFDKTFHQVFYSSNFVLPLISQHLN
jgi:hypothetical protein